MASFFNCLTPQSINIFFKYTNKIRSKKKNPQDEAFAHVGRCFCFCGGDRVFITCTLTLKESMLVAVFMWAGGRWCSAAWGRRSGQSCSTVCSCSSLQTEAPGRPEPAAWRRGGVGGRQLGEPGRRRVAVGKNPFAPPWKWTDVRDGWGRKFMFQCFQLYHSPPLFFVFFIWVNWTLKGNFFTACNQTKRLDARNSSFAGANVTFRCALKPHVYICTCKCSFSYQNKELIAN